MINVVFLTASPALVPHLAPRDDAGASLLAAARELVAQAWAAGLRDVDLVGPRVGDGYTAHSGSFAAWGAPGVSVGQGNYLPELVSRFVLAGSGFKVQDIRERANTPNPRRLTMVSLDGSAGLTPRAPLGLLDAGAWADQWCRQLLGSAQVLVSPFPLADAPLAPNLHAAGISHPQAWVDAADLAASPGAVSRAQLVASDTSLGVGRYVAGWEV